MTHSHNHFIWGAGNISTHKRYRSNKNTYHEIRKVSDRLCEEHSLSVIIPQGFGKSYIGHQKNQTQKSQLKDAIDTAIKESYGFDEFIDRMKIEHGFEAKHGKHIAFKSDGGERFIRTKPLGENYTEDSIKAKIQENYERRFPKIKVITYDDWAKLPFMSDRVAAYNLIQEYGGMKQYHVLIQNQKDDVTVIENAVTATKERIQNVYLQKEVVATYRRTKAIYDEYKAKKHFPAPFRKKHETDISAHEEAAAILKKYKRPFPAEKDFDGTIAVLNKNLTATNKRLDEAQNKTKKIETTRVHLYGIVDACKPRQERVINRTKSHDLDR